MNKYCLILCFCALLSCNKQGESGTNGTTENVINDTIPETRKVVAPAPVASYSEKIKDPLNDWKFAVEAYETPGTFRYLMKIQYKELNVTDTLTIPNFGITPKVVLKKGDEDVSCIVGFLDKKNEFKVYKKIAFEDGQLKISTLKHYARTKRRVQ